MLGFFCLSLLLLIHPSSSSLLPPLLSAPSFTNCSLQLCCLALRLTAWHLFFSFSFFSTHLSSSHFQLFASHRARILPAADPQTPIFPCVHVRVEYDAATTQTDDGTSRETCFTHSQRADPAVIKLRLCPTAIISCSIWWWCMAGRGGGGVGGGGVFLNLIPAKCSRSSPLLKPAVITQRLLLIPGLCT